MATTSNLDMNGLAVELGLRSASAARRLAIREGIPLARVGRRLIVRRSALDAFLERREYARPDAPKPAAPPWAVAILARRAGRPS